MCMPDLFYSKATEIFLDHKSWAPSSECHFWFPSGHPVNVVTASSSRWKLNPNLRSTIAESTQHRDSSSFLVLTISRGFDARVVRKISFSNGCRVCDELKREREKKIRKGINGGIVDGLWIHLFFHRCLSSGYEFWFIEDIGDPWRPIRTAHCLLQPFVGSNLKPKVHVLKKVEQRAQNWDNFITMKWSA